VAVLEVLRVAEWPSGPVRVTLLFAVCPARGRPAYAEPDSLINAKTDMRAIADTASIGFDVFMDFTITLLIWNAVNFARSACKLA
jgi:hypothetical protein